MRKFAGLALLAVVASACGTRLDEQAVYEAQGIASVDVVDGSVAPGDPGGPGAGDGETGEPGVDVGGGPAGPGATGRERDGGGSDDTVPVVGGRSGVTGDAIKVGGIFPLSGGLSTLGRPVEQAARAYFRYVNDNGGVNGRRIDFITEDDGADPNRTRSAAEKLVSQDRVFVMGPSFTPFSPDLVPFLESKGVPFIGFDGVNVEGFTSKTTVTAGVSIAPHARTLIPYWIDKTATKRIGIVYLDVPPAVSYLKDVRDVICPKLGCEVVREQPIQFTTTDYVSILVGMQQANAEGIFIVTDPASAVKLLLSAKQINYKPQPGGYLGQHGIYFDVVPESCGTFCNGVLAPTSLFPPQVSNRATDEMRRIVGRYYSDVQYGYFTELGYVSAKVFVDLLRRAGEPDRAKMLAIARSLTSYDTGGFTNPAVPISLAPGGERRRDMILVKMQDGKWVQETGWLAPRKF